VSFDAAGWPLEPAFATVYDKPDDWTAGSLAKLVVVCCNDRWNTISKRHAYWQWYQECYSQRRHWHSVEP
jgi:hypothetical protein